MSALDRPLRAVTVPSLPLESGEVLSDVAVAYHRDGPADAPVVVVIHALTGHADAVGDWWRLVAGPGRALDTTRVQVIAPNLLGSCYGSSGPATWPVAFPAVTPRDQARAIWGLLDTLGIGAAALVTGGSLGGMVALEVAALAPERVGHVAALAAPAAHTAWAIGFNHAQRVALDALGGGKAGLALARRIAMLSYRAEPGLEHRFGRTTEAEGAWRIAGWLDAHGEKLVARFDAASYRLLLDAMDAHDLGRGRASVAAALAPLDGRVTGIGISSDVLYSADLVRYWTELAGGRYESLVSPHGHDAFLIDQHHVGRLLQRPLAEGLAWLSGRAAATAPTPVRPEVAA
ncbi:MAG: alpha/beta fold hydrolase [Gemmatimonadaceae bacterium]|jgi:homoserine O-acetyltransferase|nr:alpha/beta fold hydrolase [Gemmatimonadaceae bacterium]